MARYIFCDACNQRHVSMAIKYHEYYESIKGNAIKDMLCDGSCGGSEATPINKGDICYAACLLPSNQHRNYETQKPEVWLNEFIIAQ